MLPVVKCKPRKYDCDIILEAVDAYIVLIILLVWIQDWSTDKKYPNCNSQRIKNLIYLLTYRMICDSPCSSCSFVCRRSRPICYIREGVSFQNFGNSVDTSAVVYINIYLAQHCGFSVLIEYQEAFEINEDRLYYIRLA